MSPFFKLLASVSSLAMVTGSFLYSKVAEAFDADGKKKNIPVVRVDTLSSENTELSDLIDTMVDAKGNQKLDKPVRVAQAIIPPGQENRDDLPGRGLGRGGGVGPGGGIGPGGGGPGGGLGGNLGPGGGAGPGNGAGAGIGLGPGGAGGDAS